jgi:type IV pilus assembly protein PilE
MTTHSDRQDPIACLARQGRRTGGFTLIELMIALAVIGLLAAVAYPSFQSQVRKSRRSDAVQALMQLQQAQERWRSNKATYAASTALTASWPTGLGQSGTSSGGYYTIAITGTPTATAYTATATAISGKSQASDTGCTVLTVSLTNGTTSNTPATCWSN